MSGRVGRFAPTPSGRMHIGNVYAMLAAWLSAHAGDGAGSGGEAVSSIGRPQGCDTIENSEAIHLDGSRYGNVADRGKVLLRIEDIDKPRAVKDADKWIMDDLHWLGLDWDGKPVYQSQRTGIYEEALRSLESVGPGDIADANSRHFGRSDSNGCVNAPDNRDISQDFNSDGFSERLYAGESSESKGRMRSDGSPLIYPCFCSRADLRAASAPQEGDRFLIYPGTCRKLLAENPGEVRSRLENGKRHSWRIAVPGEGGPESVVTFDDRIFGRQRFDLPREVGDTVVRRSDGIFSYQLAVVVDDLLMGVNDIVRGRDLLRSTALQIWIRRALVMSGFAEKHGIAGDRDFVDADSRYKENSNTPRANNNRPSDNQNALKTKDVRPEDIHNMVKPNHLTTCHTDATAEYPAYAHLPLIDDSTGVRLAKRKHSLDIGTLRADGVKPEQIIGYCAWLLGIRAPESKGVHMSDATGPIAMNAREALESFTWRDVRADKCDRVLEENWAGGFEGDADSR